VTQIQVPLTEQQVTALERLATARQTSVPELVRRLVEKELRTTPSRVDRETRRRALLVVGRFNSGLGDLSVRHDDYLDEAYDE
jgi:hypothetical protein